MHTNALVDKKKNEGYSMLYILFTFLLIKKNIVKQRRKNTKSLKKRIKKIFFFLLFKVILIGEIVYWCKATDNKEFIRNSNTRELRQIKCSDPCWKKAVQYIQRSWIVNSCSCYSQRVWINSISMRIKIHQTLKDVIFRSAFKSTSKWGVSTTLLSKNIRYVNYVHVSAYLCAF